MYNFSASDILVLNNNVYISNALHDYFLNNLFLAFSMGLFFGIILGFGAESIGIFTKRYLESIYSK